MFGISEKYSGQEKKEAIQKFKANGQEYQKYRLKIHPFTRDLYRYFNPRLHSNIWHINGLYKRNKYYYYIGPSLGFIDKEGNKIYDKSEQNKFKINTNNKVQIKSFPEYKYIEENQYEVIIEYCSNCEEHQTYTFHKTEIYHNYANYLKKCILLRFPFIKVILKPNNTSEIKNKLPSLNNDVNGLRKFDIRIGAFEIILCYRKKGKESTTQLLYSKLEKKKFPPIMNILDKIVSYLPTFEGEIILYEKEEDREILLMDNNNEDKKNYEIRDIIEGLEVNIYLLKNQNISYLANKATEEVQNHSNPKRMLIIKKEKKLLDKITMRTKYSCDRYSCNTNTSKHTNKILRPSSSMTNMINIQTENRLAKSHSTFNLLRQKSIKSDLFNDYASNTSEHNNNFSIKSFNFNSDINNNSPMNKYIFDKGKSDKLKGKLLIRKYTNEEGIIHIGPLPYDSYYIEVPESNQFRNVGICLKFHNLNSYKNNYIKKYIGLLTQENSFIKIQVYEINNYEPIHLSNSKVTLKKIEKKDNKEKNSINNEEMSIELEESDNSGIFEHSVPPGEYLLEIEKANYEKAKKLVTLKRGLNTINVKMSLERYYNLKIIVCNYENMKQPIHNADITIYKNSMEIIDESITNKNGEYNYLVDKGLNFLTISINKLGYFPVQRIFTRNSDTKINSKGEYEDQMIFFLVKYNYVIDNNLVLIMTYSCLRDNNFDLNGIQINNRIKNKIEVLKNDKQKNNGFVSTIIKYKNTNNKNEEILLTNENDMDDRPDNYDDIINISYIITSGKLLKDNSGYFEMNCLEKYACQTIIYTPKNIFYIPSPSFPTDNYKVWFIGWLDIKNKLFYETNILLPNLEDRILHFNEWIEFLQILIDDQFYQKLFEYFNFEKGALEVGDRVLEQTVFEERIKNLKYFKQKNNLILKFICSLFKNKKNMISFAIFKQVISSNLKNFFGNNISES